VLQSTDQGHHWNILFQDTNTSFSPHYAVAYPANNHIFIGGNFHTILRTRNGFKTIDTTIVDDPDAPPHGGIVRILFMSDTLNGIARLDGLLFITNDGWQTARRLKADWLPFYLTYMFDSLNFIGSFYEITDSFRVEGICRTTDGGYTWHKFYLPIGERPAVFSIECMYFHNRFLGFAAGEKPNGIGQQSSDLIYKTTDGGFTWEKIYDRELEPKFGLDGICFRDSLYGIAVGPWGKVLETTDGGNVWKRVPRFPGEFENAPVLTCAFAGQYAIIGAFGYGLWLMWKETISSTTEEYSIGSQDFSIFPNPFSESVKIQFNVVINEPIEIEFYDSMGNLVERQQIEYPKSEVVFTPLDRSEGVYFYRIKTREGTYSGSILKIK
jgi:photosystem II stability/assembly factor-like uncharacterized protein